MSMGADTFDEDELNLDALAQVENPIPTGLGGIKERKQMDVTVTLHDGATLTGKIGVSSGARLSDFLNESKDFVILIDKRGKAHIVNRHYIVKVIEVET